jgi:hypothetical protein
MQTVGLHDPARLGKEFVTEGYEENEGASSPMPRLGGWEGALLPWHIPG